ncbi:GNAT family N-acetyltransferase [Chitinibacter fontanus]|uniref:GNAT family N-acetyltransferase n=1 Tax=Chitinibacter fontanus TaxID=1737446 RepID=A0A7D5VAE2_9NEIS|nr:GNAT family protein [Chitinibacter fontanus]QLI81958.1 GNAT family N-acetyltransferase [Chitinibacter fontanus]
MILRQATVQDAEFLLQLRSDPAALKYMPLVKLDLPAMQARIVAVAKLLDCQGLAELMMIVELDGQAIGMVGANQRSSMMQYTEVSYSLLPQYQGRGLATQALRLWVSQLFAAGYRGLGATISALNLPSQALAERVGFVREGVMREHFVIGSQAQDQVIYGLLASEWQQAQKGSQNVPD